MFENSSSFELGVKGLLENNGWFHYTYGLAHYTQGSYLCPNFNSSIAMYGRLKYCW